VPPSLEGSLDSGLATFGRAGGPSAAYAIGADGRIVLVVPENAVAWHVAAWGSNPALNRHRPDWLPPFTGSYSAVNAATIGIELAGFAAEGFAATQYTALGHLVADICRRWGLLPRLLPEWGTAATITTHAYLQTDRTDPGAHFDWSAFTAALTAATGTSESEGEMTAEERAALQERVAALETDQAIQHRRKMTMESYLRGTALYTKRGRRYRLIPSTIADDLIAGADAEGDSPA